MAHRHRVGRALSPLAACLAVALLATGCSAGDSQHTAGTAAGSRSGQRQSAAPGDRAAADPAPMVLQVIPAPFQLPAGISGAVSLVRGADLMVAGGTTAGQRATGAVTALDPVTGRTWPEGKLATPVHDSAGLLLAGQPVIFGGAGGTGAATAAARTGAHAAQAARAGRAGQTVLAQAAAADQAGRAGQAGPAGQAVLAQAGVADQAGRAGQAGPAGQTVPAGQAVPAGRAVQAVRPGGRAAPLGALPSARSGLTAVTVAGTAYLLGGSDAGSFPADVLATRDGRSFRAVARLPVPVCDAAVAAIGSRIWLFGGRAAAGMTDVIQQLDVTTGAARVVGHLPYHLADAAGFELNGTIYLAGGTSAATGRPGTRPARAAPTSDAVLRYEPSNGHLGVAARLPVPVANAAAAVIGGTAYLVGGTDAGKLVPTVVTLRLGRPAGASPAAPWLSPARGAGRLAPGSRPAALPADVLIADHLNNRLVIVDPRGRLRWVFPRRGDLRPGQTFRVPDDAFFTPDGRYIVATQEDDQVISVIDVASRKIVYRYGLPGKPGMGPNRVDNPDDAMVLPDGDIISADIKNCRILIIRPPRHRPLKIIGHSSNVCFHNPPRRFGSPNGAFPLTDGRYLVTEINGDWIDEVSLTGHVYWSANPPAVAYPSDTNEISPGRYLTADYSAAGQVVEFTAAGRTLWRMGGLNHPSLALPLPNGNILVNDDFNDRVIVINPVTHRVVWQYGHTGQAAARPGFLNDPDGVDLVPPDSLLITHASTMGQR